MLEERTKDGRSDGAAETLKGYYSISERERCQIVNLKVGGASRKGGQGRVGGGGLGGNRPVDAV